MKDSIENKLEHLAGQAKETAGKMMGSEKLELEGKLQRLGSELMHAGSELGEAVREKATHKANDLLDHLEKKTKGK